jgi:predicted PurR-regulated permease PerM
MPPPTPGYPAGQSGLCWFDRNSKDSQDITMTDDQTKPTDAETLNTTVIDLALRLALLGLLIYFSLTIISPFFAIIVWGVVLAVALYPVFSVLANLLGGRRKLAAVLVTAICLLVVLGPATWLAFDLVEVLRTIYERLDAGTLTIPPPDARVRTWPVIGQDLFSFWELASGNLKAAIVQVAPHLKPFGASLVGAAGSAGTGIIEFLLAVVLAGFLLAPGPSLVEATGGFSRRLVSQRGEEFVQLAGATIRNVSQGVIGVSLIQALLAGIGLMVAHVPGASLIAIIVLILGIVQIGPSLIIVPVIIWSWFSMETVPALLFTLYMVPVNLIDNVLKPIIMGRGLRTPMLVILLGVLGGTVSSGIIGLFIGPIVLAVAWDLLVAWVGDDKAAPA